MRRNYGATTQGGNLVAGYERDAETSNRGGNGGYGSKARRTGRPEVGDGEGAV